MLSYLALGNSVEPSVARQVANHFWTVVTGDESPGRWTDISTEAGFQEFYIFTREAADGFVIVSADNSVQPILGYSTDSRFITPLPAHVFSFLQRYEQEITYCREHSIPATNEIEQQWNSLIEGTYAPQLTTAVAPLLTTTWDQSPYYNNLCPDSSGVHAVTGCVATATAQIMKFWNWPATGNGSHSYYDDNFGYQSANFGATTYNWNQMPNALNASSSATQVNAVATLMYHIGVAVEMGYGIDASSAMMNSYGYSGYACAENALKNYFRYKNTLHSVYKDEVTNSYWINTLTNELDAGRPLLERGAGDAGGHAFVCDGYDNNGLFHINWGWGSYQDGYFAQNALNPGNYTFNDGTAVIVGIEPNGALFVSTPTLTFPQEGGSQTFTVTPNSTGSTPWSASSNASWLTLTPSSGSASFTSTVTATATANNTGVMRSAVITVTQGSQSVTIQVAQSECSSNDMCSITLQMTDSYGDGWNNAYLTLSSSSGYVYGTATCEGSFSSQTFSVCSSNLLLTWTSGQWDSECAFTVLNSDGTTLLTESNTPSGSYTINNPCNSELPTDSCTITQFPWNESFENDISCWSVIDGDGDGNNWFWATGAPYDGTHSMASYSYNSNLGGALYADNLLVTPAISLPATGSYNLVFYARCGNASYPDDIAVRLTTGAGTAFSDFNVTLMPLTTVTTTAYQQYTISLAAYQGQTVKIAFVHNTYDGLYLSLDAVSITGASSSSYQITTLSANSTMGSASGGGTYSLGESVSITATAQPGYRFTGWDDGNTENPRTIIVSGDATYTAYFDDLGTTEHHYDNGTYAGNIGAGGTLYWGIRFPAGELSNYNMLNAVKIFDKYAGTYELNVYQGGTSTPGTLVYSQSYTLNGTEDWYTATLTTPVTINPTQPLWITFYNTDVDYPAAGSNYVGNPDGSWVSVDGQSWASVCDYGFHYTWMIRAMLSNSAPSQQYTVTVNSAQPSMGTASGGGSFYSGDSISITASAQPGYRFTGWDDGNTENPRTVVVSGNATYTAYFDNLGTSEHHYDNGIFAGNIGAGATLYWGIRFSAGELSGYNILNAVKILDYYAGTYELRVYQGGTSTPSTLVYSQSYTLYGTEDWYTATLTNPVTINHSQPLWITFYNTDVDYPAAGSNYAGNPDGSWVSTDGQTWASVCDYGFYYTWMIRAMLSNSAPQQYTITVNSAQPSMGTASGGGSFYSGDSISITASAQPGYRFTGWDDGNTENPRTIIVSGDATYTAYFDDLGTTEHHYDNGTYAGNIGAGGTLYWGIRFPAGELSNYNMLNAVKIFDKYAGTYELNVYQGGTSTPGTLVYSQSYTLNGTEDWYTATLTTPVTINPTQPLWITFYNTDVDYPAAGSNYVGNPDGSWVSVDGQSWASVCDYGFHYTWMIRAMLSNSEPPTDTCTITQFPWTESFENWAPCWTVIDGDYDGNNWNITSGDGYSGTHSATSNYIYNTSNPGFCYNFLISPSITLPANGTPILTFYAHSGSVESFGTLSVFLTTGDGTSPSDFNVNVMSFVPITTTAYQQYIFNLSAYCGQTIKLAFVHTDMDNSSNSLSIDDVSIITNPASCNITVSSANSAMGIATGGGTYTMGDSISLIATAQVGYRFTGWNDGNTENPRSIIVSGDATYIANFDNLGTNEHHYDNGIYAGCIGAGGTLYWGIRFPASELSNYNTLDAVKIMDVSAGTYELRIYQGGSNAPGTLVYNQNFTLNGTMDWYTATLATPVSINNSQSLWIIFYNTDADFPAAGSTYAGNHDGSWVSTNGQSWTTINNYGYYYTWMIRAMLSNSTPQQYTITVNSAQPEMGTAFGGGTFDYGTNIFIRADAYAGYEFVQWNDGSTENPRTVTVTGDATYTAYFQPTVGIEDISNPKTNIYSYSNNIVVDNAEGVSVEIYDMAGKLIVSEACNNSSHRVFTVNANGVYVVRTSNGVTKKVTVIRY